MISLLTCGTLWLLRCTLCSASWMRRACRLVFRPYISLVLSGYWFTPLRNRNIRSVFGGEGEVWEGKALTALRQHALLRLLQFLGALSRIRLQHPLTCSDAPPTRHAALAPVRPGRQHAGDGVCEHHVLLCWFRMLKSVQCDATKAAADSRHSGIMHFSTSATSVLHIDPSIGGIFTMRSRLLMPTPQVMLQGSHSPHSVTTQLLGAVGSTKSINLTTNQ